ncbi:putative polyketide synthase protein [Eutypa lata UCREL1]|uniref:Putative polyketide synthase protein n=1 Tax=Eutypa lata (strain UCR-EL1) TaxID=1287681 RepID=M7TCX4_EUTLA|nr:putative polyketide synthase protein [Eutypa lata UCREL1]
MKTLGTMFAEDVDPADFDAPFFGINYLEACSMDLQQRQLMEVSYECLENAGIPLEKLSGQRVGISVDAACSSTLTALGMACLYLGNYQVDASPSGRCHTFDKKADGYVAAEAINVIFLKRLRDAVRDGDPIRAVIRGTAVNSAGKTPGITMPDAGAQAKAIRAAYANAKIPEAEFRLPSSKRGRLETTSKQGDRVLIHAATGGVGISAIQLCNFIGAEIYATIGTQEKRDFLKLNYKIPDERIFSSRTLEHTGGKGVDVILNSLAGDLLQESWCIIANGEDVRRAFRDASAPIAGVIQGSMVLCDQQDASLDFFTLLSSVSGLCGNKGQANYAAANAFLDAFASSRRSLGLSACSVDLGVIADVGYMAERDYLKSRYDDAVWHVIDERLLRKIFGFSILQQQQPAPVNIQSASQMITGLRVAKSKQAIAAIRVMIRSKAENKATLDMTSHMLNDYLMRSLRLSDPLDFARPLSAYGIDSLAAVEFRKFLKVELHVELTTIEVVNAPSLVSICEKIIEQISKM